MNTRLKAVLCLTLGFVISYFFFPSLFDLGAYAIPKMRIQMAYEVDHITEVPPEVINNPDFLDLSGRVFGYIAGIVLGILPFLTGIYFAKKYWREGEDLTGLPKSLFHLLAVGFILSTIFMNGFFFLGANEAMATRCAGPGDYRLSTWTEFLMLKDDLHTGYGNLVEYEDEPIFSVLGKHLYWFTPFGGRTRFELRQEFEIVAPLMIPLYQYTYDEDGKVTGIMEDDLGTSIVTGFLFFTKEGVKLYAPATWSQLRYNPDFEASVIQVKVQGAYRVIDPGLYSKLIDDSHHAKLQYLHELGYYGEMVDAPTPVEQLENYLFYMILMNYLMSVKIPMLLQHLAVDHPSYTEDEIYTVMCQYLLNYPRDVIVAKWGVPSFLEYLRSKEVARELDMVIEWFFGIQINDYLQVQVVEELL